MMTADITESVTTEINSSTDEDDRPCTDFSEATKKLTIGFLNIYQPPLEQIKKELKDLTNKQETLLNELQTENRKLNETLEDVELNEMFTTIKVYQGKLALIKKQMLSIHERTSKLKKRALRVQQMKQKEASNKEHQREQESHREQELIAQPSSSSSS